MFLKFAALLFLVFLFTWASFCCFLALLISVDSFLINYRYFIHIFPFTEKETAYIDTHLHGDLFVQGRCESGFYEYRSACYMLVDPPLGIVRTPILAADNITTACQKTVLFRNCSAEDYFGTPACPIVMAPHDQLEAAFHRSLIEKFSHSDMPYNAPSAWVGIKANNTYVYVSFKSL